MAWIPVLVLMLPQSPLMQGPVTLLPKESCLCSQVACRDVMAGPMVELLAKI